MKEEELKYLQEFSDNKDTSKQSDINKFNSLFTEFASSCTDTDSVIKIAFQNITVLRPENLNILFKNNRSNDEQFEYLNSVTIPFDFCVKISVWAYSFAYYANKKNTDHLFTRKIADKIVSISHGENSNEIYCAIKKNLMFALADDAELPNFFLIEDRPHELKSFKFIIDNTNDSISKPSDKTIRNIRKFDNWFKYGAFAEKNLPEQANSIANEIEVFSKNIMQIMNHISAIEHNNQQLQNRIQNLEKMNCDLNKTEQWQKTEISRLTKQNNEINDENNTLKNTIEDMKEMSRVTQVKDNKTADEKINKLAAKLIPEYKQWKEASAMEMTADIGDVMKTSLETVFYTLIKSGIPLEEKN